MAARGLEIPDSGEPPAAGTAERTRWELRRIERCVGRLWKAHTFETVPCREVDEASVPDDREDEPVREPAPEPSTEFQTWLDRRVHSCIESRFKEEFFALDDYVCEYMVGSEETAPIEVECYDYTKRLQATMLGFTLVKGEGVDFEEFTPFLEWNPDRCPGPIRGSSIPEGRMRDLYFNFSIDPSDGICLPGRSGWGGLDPKFRREPRNEWTGLE